MKKGRLLVTGAGGMVGHATCAVARTEGWEVVATARHPLGNAVAERVEVVDVEDWDATRAVVERVAPTAVIHAAAMAQPAACERDPERATRVNVGATRVLVEGCVAAGARLVLVSTDLVFDGTQGQYTERDAVAPLSHYGRTKVAAEEAVRGGIANHVVARASLLLGPSPAGDRGADDALARQVAAGERPKLFVDEYRSPLGAWDLARVLVHAAGEAWTGVVHVGGPERLSRMEIGLQVAEARGWDAAVLQAVHLRDMPMVPPRAPDTSLDSSHLRRLVPATLLPAAIRHVLRAGPRFVPSAQN